MKGHWLFRAAGGLALVAAVIIVGCSSKSSQELEGMVGTDTITTIRNSEEVETFRIESKSYFPEHRDPEGERINGFLVIRKGQTQRAEFGKRLRAILLRDSSYKESGAKCFEPGVVYRFNHDNKSVDVLICFMCDNVDIQPNSKHQAGIDVQLAGLTKEARNELLKLTKEAFSDDPEIQAIEDR